MLSAVIAAGDDPVELAETLAALVPAAMEGLVREAIVVADRPNQAVRALADAAGARLVEASGGPAAAWRAGAGVARGPWLLLLVAGLSPTPGWADVAARALARPARPGAAFAFGVRSEGARLATLMLGARGLATRLTRRPSPEHGLMVRAVDWRDMHGRPKVERLAATLLDNRRER